LLLKKTAFSEPGALKIFGFNVDKLYDVLENKAESHFSSEG